ncbi:MAG: AraC family transcriptional regulator [Clostridia bacterium]|nr:AraC family transcriptional regulator [Clostridia bacterium]
MNGAYYIPPAPIIVEHGSHKADWSMTQMHYHSAYELVIIEKGSCSMLVGENTFVAEQYDVFSYSPNMLHKNNGGAYHARTVIYFNDDYMHKYFTIAAAKQLTACFSSIRHSLSEKEFAYISFQVARLAKSREDFMALGNILSFLCAMPASPKGNANRIDDILKYINSDFKEIHSLSDIALHFYISKEHLCRSFKKETGVTLSEYINAVRIQNACNMLCRREFSVTDIGFACGFNSAMYFCKTFKKIIGKTPKEFRKSKYDKV